MTVLVIDAGSSSMRALLFDDSAQPIAMASRPHDFVTTPPGAATTDAANVQAMIESCLDEILQHPQAHNISVVGMDTFVGNLLGVDSSGHPLTPIFTYADIRSADDVAALKERIDIKAAHQRTGCLLHTAYLPGRLAWLRRTDPQLFLTVTCWVDFGTYLFARWFGQASCSYSVASWSGLLNRTNLDWDDEWLHVLELDKALLPSLADYSETQTGLLPEYAQRWPALREVPFCLAVGDGVAANVGSGCVDEAHIALTVGTTAALRVVTSARLTGVPNGLWSYRMDAPHHLIGGATSEGGNIFNWAQETLMLDKDVELQLVRREPDAHGLTILPFLAGERSPGWATDATGTITGLRLSTTPLDMLQAAMESVALRLSLIAEQLSIIADKDVTIVGGGGALAASDAWTQMIANALNRPIHLTSEPEITARGTAILALRAIGKANLADFPPQIERIVQPNPAHVTALQAARQRQDHLYRKIIVEKWNY
jgi:gluconokinase